MRRNVAEQIALLALCFSVGACVIPSATSPAGAPAAPATVAPSTASAPATVTDEDRIAGLSRVDLLGGAGVAAFKLEGEVQKVDVTTVAVTGQPFTDAIRATIKEGSGHEWAVQLVAENAAPIDSGDAILATFFLRTETPQDGGIGETEFVFELNGSPYPKSIQYPVQAAGAWTKVQVRFKAARAYAPGEAHAIFRLGYDPQTIELGGVKVESFGKQVASGRCRRPKTPIVGASATRPTLPRRPPPRRPRSLPPRGATCRSTSRPAR